MPEPLLSVKGLCFLHLGPFSLNLHPQERLSLSGPSGRGKSQLLRALTDLIPAKGEVIFQGQPTQTIAPQDLRRQIGYLPAQSAWWYERPRPHFLAPAQLPLQQLDLTPDILDQELKNLSSGERQRLALLRLLENQPRLLLLDEPSAALDPRNTLLLETLVLDYLRKTKAGLIWVGHDPIQARRLCTRHLQLLPQGLQKGQYELEGALA